MLVCFGAPAQLAREPLHVWDGIDYPAIPVPWGVDLSASVSLSPDASGLRCDVIIATTDPGATFQTLFISSAQE